LSLATTANGYNDSDHLLPGIYVNGNVDYINLYAAKSASNVAAPDLQVVEIKQGSNRFRFTLDRNRSTTKVQVDTGSGYGTAVTYNKLMNGTLFVEGNVGDYTQNCTSKESCRGIISIPPDNSAATLSFAGGNDTPSVQKDWGLSVFANGNIDIQDNLNYQVDPRGANRQFDNPDLSGTQDDPALADGLNSLGIVAFESKSVENADGSVTTTLLSNGGNVYWGKGLGDNRRLDYAPDGTTRLDTIDIQASIYGRTVGLGSGVGRLAEFIRLLGGEIQSTAGADFSSGCNTNVTLPSNGGSYRSSVCAGGRMYLTGDRRLQNGTLSPPAFPVIPPTAGSYLADPVGRQSLGRIRWQMLPYQAI
jgi:hypothetical protein